MPGNDSVAVPAFPSFEGCDADELSDGDNGNDSSDDVVITGEDVQLEIIGWRCTCPACTGSDIPSAISGGQRRESGCELPKRRRLVGKTKTASDDASATSKPSSTVPGPRPSQAPQRVTYKNGWTKLAKKRMGGQLAGGTWLTFVSPSNGSFRSIKTAISQGFNPDDDIVSRTDL